MKFTAHVTLVDAPAVQKQQTETARAKQLLLEAFQILSKNDSSVMAEAQAQAQAFLQAKGVHA